MTPRPWLLVALLTLAALQSPAAEVRGVRVTREGGRFIIEMDVVLDAAPRAVFRALGDYAAMARYNPDLRAVRVEPTAQPDRVRLLTTIHTCVLLFCKTMHQEQLMRSAADEGGGSLQATLIPNGGAFGGDARWTVRACRSEGTPTCLHARMVLVPQFWVPPLIGPWIIRRKMYEEAQLTSHGLEQEALRSASR